MSEEAKSQEFTMATLREFAEKPLLALPPMLRQQTFLVWSAYQYLAGMDSPSVLVFPMLAWMNSQKIPPETFVGPLNFLLKPSTAQYVKFTADLIGQLAEQVHKANQRRFADPVPGLNRAY